MVELLFKTEKKQTHTLFDRNYNIRILKCSKPKMELLLTLLDKVADENERDETAIFVFFGRNFLLAYFWIDKEGI